MFFPGARHDACVKLFFCYAMNSLSLWRRACYKKRLAMDVAKVDSERELACVALKSIVRAVLVVAFHSALLERYFLLFFCYEANDVERNEFVERCCWSRLNASRNAQNASLFERKEEEEEEEEKPFLGPSLLE